MRVSLARALCGPAVLLGLAFGPAPLQAVHVDAFGVKAGVAYVWSDFQYEGAEVIDPSAVLTPAAGVFMELRRGRRSRFNLLVEAVYVRKGYEADRSQLVPNETDPAREVYADFLSIPVLLRSNVRDGDVSLYLFFGPSVEILLDSDPDPVLSRYKDLALAGHAGLGLEYGLNRSTSLTGELRFNADFTNVYEPGEDDSLRSVTHRILELLGGIRF